MKALIYIFSLFLGIALFPSCNKVSNNRHANSSTFVNDSVFINKIRNLNLIISKEKEGGVLDYYIKDTPTNEHPYYVIQVGKMNQYRLEIFYNFYCYPRSGEIKLYDTVNDTLIIPR